MIEQDKKKQDFVKEFNLDSPWNNPDIENVVTNMLTMFCEEATKLYNRNDMSYSDKQRLNYSDVTKDYVFMPAHYIARSCKMLILNHEGKIPTDQTLNYSIFYKRTLNNALSDSFDTVSEYGEKFSYILFEEKCRSFYHMILEHQRIKNEKHTYTSSLFDMDSQIIVINRMNGTAIIDKNMTRVEEHQKLMNKCFCDVVAYGYMTEKAKYTCVDNPFYNKDGEPSKYFRIEAIAIFGKEFATNAVIDNW